jgi:hypothetical protein
MPLADRVRAAGTRTGPIIVGAIVLQWLSTLCAVIFESNHVGWRFEQGTGALASVQGAFGLADGELPREGPGLLWPIAMSPFASVADTLDGVLVGVVLLNVLVLAPLALVSVYWVAARIGGRLLGACTVALWVLGPWVLMLAGLERYDPVIRDRVLPLVLGLTAEPAFPAAVALVSSAALIATSLDRRSLGGAALAGLLAGAAVAIEPHSLLFLGGAAGAYVASRRIPEAGAFALALVPAVLAVALWTARAVDGPDPLSFGPVDWGQFTENMAGLREFFWSQRLLQWLPIAGTIAVARRAPPLALLLGGWTLSFGVVQGSQPDAGLDGGGIFRVLLPALPAYVLLAAAIPLLVPTLSVRFGGRLDPLSPGRRPGRRALVVAAIVLAAVPLATAALGTV